MAIWTPLLEYVGSLERIPCRNMHFIWNTHFIWNQKFFLQVQITSQDSMCKLKYQAFQLAKAPDRQIPILYAAISIALSIQLNWKFTTSRLQLRSTTVNSIYWQLNWKYTTSRLQLRLTTVNSIYWQLSWMHTRLQVLAYSQQLLIVVLFINARWSHL